MAKYSIKWGIEGGPQNTDVIEAVSLFDALQKADELAEDLWESNKIATAKPIKEETTKCTGTAVTSSPPSS